MISVKPETMLVWGALDLDTPNAATIHLTALAKSWADSGQQIILAVPQSRSGNPPIETLGLADSPNLVLLPLARPNWPKNLPNSITALRHLPRLIWLTKRQKISMVYLRLSPMGCCLTMAMRLLTRAHIISEHNGWMADDGKAMGHNHLLTTLEAISQKLDGFFAHRIRAVTPELADLLAKQGVNSNKLFVVGNGVCTKRLQPVARATALARLNLPPEPVYLGFIGNLVIWQGMTTALQALAILRRNHADIHLLIAGDGRERQALEQQAAELKLTDAVHFLGQVSLADAANVIGAFDIAIAPFTQNRNSRIGSSSLKLRDYAACGRPVVAADIPGVASPETRDWLIPHQPDDAADLARQLGLLVTDQPRCIAMGQAARSYAEQHYDWHQIADLIEQEVRKAPPPPRS